MYGLIPFFLLASPQFNRPKDGILAPRREQKTGFSLTATVSKKHLIYRARSLYYKSATEKDFCQGKAVPPPNFNTHGVNLSRRV
jgi:hypothetical protein